MSSDFIDRVRQRASDPETRNDAPNMKTGISFDGGVFKTVRMSLGGDGTASRATVLPPAATEAEIAAAEETLGLALPADCRQLYCEVAHGGFGPGDGLASVDAIAMRYHDLQASPPGEGGQTWPANLLPIGLTEPGADCYDLDSGHIVLWDEESLEDGSTDEVWNHSFKHQAESLQTWLEAWLSKPPLREKQRSDMEESMCEGLRASLEFWRAKSPEERAEMGLPEEGWEDVLFGHLGIDLKNL